MSSNKSFTFAFQNRKNIAAIALSPDGNILISVDDGAVKASSFFHRIHSFLTDGRALLVNFRRGVVLHHFNFKKPVKAVEFSPNGSFIAVTHESHVQVWKTPNHLVREFAPFILHRTYTGHHDEVLSIEWSPDSWYVEVEFLMPDPLIIKRPQVFHHHVKGHDRTVIYIGPTGWLPTQDICGT